jgi:ligand-binding SRPBCC domain-containing protein
MFHVEHVFRFFADPGNLPRLMPAWQRARLDEIDLQPAQSPGERPIAAGSGTRLTLTFRPVPFGRIRLSWLAVIEDFRPNEGFCDRQLRGPFRYWRHCHRVSPAASEDGSPCTLIEDDVEYELPLGSLGLVANKLFICKQLKATFAYRHRRTVQLLKLG